MHLINALNMEHNKPHFVVMFVLNQAGRLQRTYMIIIRFRSAIRSYCCWISVQLTVVRLTAGQLNALLCFCRNYIDSNIFRENMQFGFRIEVSK